MENHAERASSSRIVDFIEVRGWYQIRDIRKIDSVTMWEDEVFVWCHDGSAGHVKREQIAPILFQNWKNA